MIAKRKTLAEETVEQIKKLITDGSLKPGDKLPTEPQLMERLGVGRSSVREAVRMLANMGLVSVRQGSGTYVEEPEELQTNLEQSLRRADIKDVDEVRRILETSIVEKALLRRSEADLRTFKTLLAKRKEYAEQGALQECINADLQFHAALAAATHNPVLSDLYNMVSEQLRKGFQHIYTDTTFFMKSQKSHEDLLRYIERQDMPRAMRTIKLILEEP